MNQMLMKVALRLVVALCLAGAHPGLNAQELDFTTGLDEFRELRTMLHAHVRRLGMEQLEKRREEVSRWTASDVRARKRYVRERMQESLGGPFPERTPLNPRFIGVIDRGDYRIEKIVFESQPAFYVTANLYIPTRGQPPFPAVLYPLGHETGAQGPVQFRSYGVIHRAGYSIEKLVYDSEPGIVVPALFFLPQGGPPKKPTILWVHGRGKSTDAEPEGDIAGLVRAGAAVLAIDARGCGATEPNMYKTEDWTRWFSDYNSAMTALLLGKTLVGMRAQDITRAIDLLTTRPEVDPERIAAVGLEGAAVPLLHAAVLDPRIRKVALERMMLSYAAVLDRPIHRQIFENVINGVLRSYDLPILAAAISPRPVLIVDAVDSVGNLVKLDRVRSEYGSAGSGQIQRRGRNQPASSLYSGLLQ
ncbi:MAG: alpha/beta hydrolase [Opitutaceae bacterium]